MKTMLNSIFGTGNAAGRTCATGRAMSRLAKLFVLSVSLSGLGAWGGNANAATCTSTAAGGNWNAPGTWNVGPGGCLGVPLATDNVIIATTGAGAVTVNVQASMTNLTVNAGSTLTIQGGGNFRIRPTGTTTISGTLNFGTTTSSSRFSGLVTVTATGSWSNSGNQAVTFRGGITNNGTFSGGTGTQTFDTNSQTIGGTSPINFGGIVAVSGAVTITNTNTAGVTIAGNLTGNNAGSTWVNGANSTLNYGGAATPMGTRVFTASAAGNTVNYIGAAQTVDLPTLSTYYNLTLSGSGAKTMPATAMTVAGNFSMSGTATATAAAALAVGGDFTIGTGATFNAGAFNHTVGGNWSETGTFNPGAGTVTLNGAIAQTISGTSPVGFNNLTVTNATSPNITLATNVTVTGTLTGTVVLTYSCPDFTLTSATPAQVLHSCPPPLAEYRMDEASWNGTANEVADSSGNGNNAQSFNSANTDSVTPAIATDPGTCRYGVFDNGTTVTQGYVQTPLPDLTTDFTVTAWVRTTNNTVQGQRILIDDQNNSGGYGISLGDGGAGLIRFYSRGITPIILDSTYAIANNTWYFMAAVADITNKKRTIYVFDGAGALLNSTTETAWTGGTWGSDAGPVSIGGEVNGPPQTEPPANFHFRGNLDEVRVYRTALNQNALASIATQTHVCPIILGPDHIRVQHDGNGLTCTPETLTVIACANAACTAPHYTATAVSGNVTWAGAPGGSVAFNITTGGTTTVSLPVTTVQTVTLGTGAVSPAPINVSDCWNLATATASCSLPFADSGLLVSAPNHIAETAQSVTISAVRKANNALDCVPAFSGVSRTVNLKCTYANPATGTLPARVAGVALNSGNNPAQACDATGQSPTLAFSASGTATATLQYADVGQVTLNATYTGSAATADAGLVMSGSGSFIAAPASFAFSAITAAPIKAGTNFGATVTAMNAAATPAATPNFGKETAPGMEGVSLSFTKCQPTGVNAVGGMFSGSVGAFTSGSASATNLNWSEVGNGDLVATLTSGSYLGSGLTATGNTGIGGTTCNGTGGAGNVGRVIPHHFITTVTDGCTGCGFTYSGQPFTVSVTAQNGLTIPTTTINYDGTSSTAPNFAKVVTLSAWDAATGTTPNPGGALTNTSVAAADFVKGAATINATNLAPATLAPIYTFTTVPTVPTSIRVRADDNEATSSGFTEGTTETRSGRIKVSNAYGSELLPLTLTATAQYYSATGWANSVTDNVTNLTLAATYNLLDKNGNTTGTTAASKSPASGLSAGKLTITLAKPSGGASGVATIAPTAPGYLPVTPGTGTFGVYKGNNSYIYRRESY